MENKRLILSIFLVFGVMLTLGIVSATLTVNIPTASQHVNGTLLFNITTAIPNALNCTWSTTANSNFAFTKNASAGQTEFTNSTNTATLTNAHDTTLTVICRNATASETGTRTFSIDNSNPSCDFGIDQEYTERQSGVGITVTDASTDTTTLTWAYTLTNDAGTTKATSTSQNPVFSNGDLEDLGEHTITLIVTDEVGKKATCTETFLVKGSSDDEQESVTQGAVSGATEKKTSSMLWILIILAVVVIVAFAVVIWYLMEESKGKKRR